MQTKLHTRASRRAKTLVAAALVATVLALFASALANPTPASAATDLDGPGQDEVFGHGRLDL